MRTVIERHDHSIDEGGSIHYDDRPSTYEAAEQLAGKRLDRRRDYATTRLRDHRRHGLRSSALEYGVQRML